MRVWEVASLPLAIHVRTLSASLDRRWSFTLKGCALMDKKFRRSSDWIFTNSCRCERRTSTGAITILIAKESARNQLSKRLRGIRTPLASVAIGFDGFVDEMITVVSERHDLDSFTPVPDIATFGALITRAAGHSSLREIIVNAVHPGGCAVNMGDGLAAMGVPVDCFATLGDPIHAAFAPIASRFRACHSWGREPGRTLAFEFADGKLMYSAVRQLADFTPAHVETLLTTGAYQAAAAQAAVIALTNWTLYPHMTAVWRLLAETVYGRLPHRPAFIIDLVDPSSRSTADIRLMTEVLPLIESCGPVVLGLNGNEANILARIFNVRESSENLAGSADLAATLRTRLGISEVAIHCVKFAVAANATTQASILGPFCASPKKSTGAGDRFNAGYCLGMLLDVDISDRLTLACACSGHFVREARSANLAELADFLTSPFWEQKTT